MSIIRTRLLILRNDIEIEKATLLKIGLLAVVSVFFLGVGLILLTLLVVVTFWQEHRVPVLAGLTAIYWMVGVGAAAQLRQTIRTRDVLLSHTLAELLKDQDVMVVENE